MDIAAAQPACRYLFPKILDVLGSHGVPEASGLPNGAVARDTELPLEAITNALGNVVKLLDKALASAGLNYPPWLPALLEVLANATREQPFWRPIFGHPRPQGNGHSSTCILDAVRLLIKADIVETKQVFSQHDELLKPTLRIIANSCADDNVSRALMIDAGAVDDLKSLVAHDRALDLVIPTIYNVCVDFDRVALDEVGKPLKLDQLDTVVELTAAEQALGRCSNLAATTTLQLVLQCSSKLHEATLGFLADLVEMSSRPVLFGDYRILDPRLHHGLKERREVIRDVLTVGRRIIEEDEDTTAAIIQTLLNLLSQTSFQEAMAQSADDLLGLVNMFGFLPDTDLELKRYADSLSQMLYAVSSRPEFVETFAPGSEAYQDLCQKLEQDPSATGHASLHELGGPIVLLANSLTTPERISQSFVEPSDLTRTVANIIKDASSSIILVPAFDLANRLALSPEGQFDFTATRILDILLDKLQPPLTSPSPSPSQNHTLTIHRSAIVLARQLIKPYKPISPSIRPVNSNLYSHPTKSSSFDPLHSTILALFTTTPDDATKLEIGRYAVAFLRWFTSDVSADDSNTHLSDKAVGRINPLLQPLIHLLSASPSPAGRGEGLFGLGLFSALATTRTNDDDEALSWESLVVDHEKAFAALGQILDAAEEGRRGARLVEERCTADPVGGGRVEEAADETTTVTAQSPEAPEEGAAGHERRTPEEQNVIMVIAQLSQAIKAEPTCTDNEFLEGRSQLVEGLQVLAQRMGLQM